MSRLASLPHPRAARRRTSSDDWVARGLILVVASYLVVTLIFPLFTMVTRSVEVFRFDLDLITVQFQTEAGWQAERSVQDWIEATGHEVNAGVRVSERSREQILRIIPRAEFQGVDLVRVHDRSDGRGLVMVAGQFIGGGNSWEGTPADLRRVQIRPVGEFGLANYTHYFATPTLRQSIVNSFAIALGTTGIVVPLAFAYAFALTRSCIPFKSAFRTIALVPILVPSLLPAIGLVYLFGRQGILTPLLMGESIYGPIGIVMASVFFVFPHAVLILTTALTLADQRLYEAAKVLNASPWRTFWTVTLPAARYGLISAAFVTFTLVITDFGVPKVIGGNVNVLALDIYKQVVGQQNFQLGAVVSMVLLLPAVVAFTVDRIATRRQVAMLNARTVPLVPRAHKIRDRTLLVVCSLMAIFILGILAMCQFAALFQFWPYDLSFSLRNYDFDRMDGGGWAAYWNSIRMATYTAVIGTAAIFLGAYLVEKAPRLGLSRDFMQFMAMLPMAVPGMVLGLSYIFFFNDPTNPLNTIYGTMAILVVSTITHFYTVAHLTAVTALKQMDKEFEAVSESLKQPFWRTLRRVTIPVCLPSILDIAIYMFVNAMTTVSAVVFLYSTHTALASVAILNMDDAGDIAPAAAMGMMIFYTNIAARLLHMATSRAVRSSQAWRQR
ncbi:MAG: putative 2-aminoethylphosphonate ABC transporter permease subunit [Geminicoccaceae bacterium]|nr:MAG: putative 2-aminoethylphosphonate ABC transporter permease subunit [Geminicoccaceae bacterium]